MKDNKNKKTKQKKVEETINEQEQIKNENVQEQENKNCKSNKLFVIVIIVIAMALTFGCGLMLGKNLFDSKKDNKEKQNNQEQINNTTKEESNFTYVDIRTKYVNKTNRKYDIELKKKKIGNEKGHDIYSYALYDKTSNYDITDFEYGNGVYYDYTVGGEFGSIEKSCKAYVINVNGNDYIYIYIVASMFEGLDGSFLIYSPDDKSVIKDTTNAIGENLFYDDGQFAILLHYGTPEISAGWYNNYYQGEDKDAVIFSDNGKFTRKKAPYAVANSNNTFTFYMMESENEFENANYSNSKVDIYNVKGDLVKTYKNVVSVMSDYILALDGNNLVIYDVNGNKNIVEKNVSKYYIYNPSMHIAYDNKNIIEIIRQKKSSYDGWSGGEKITYQINK